MLLNQATDYAFRAVLFLAMQPPGKLAEAQAIAEQEHIPARFLLKIMPSLIQAGIVASQRGIGGGYRLAKEPAVISLLDVLEAIEGPIRLNRCLIDPESCSKLAAAYCPVHSSLEEVQSVLTAELKRRNFADLINPDSGRS